LQIYAGIVYDTSVPLPQIVIDTNVFIAALRSRRGASYKLLNLVDSGLFEANISVPLILEYEEQATRISREIRLSVRDIIDIIDYICSVANHRKIHFHWRPTLTDPEDEMVLELAIAAEEAYIVTFNHADFRGAAQFGIRILTPGEFLKEIGALP